MSQDTLGANKKCEKKSVDGYLMRIRHEKSKKQKTCQICSGIGAVFHVGKVYDDQSNTGRVALVFNYNAFLSSHVAEIARAENWMRQRYGLLLPCRQDTDIN